MQVVSKSIDIYEYNRVILVKIVWFFPHATFSKIPLAFGKFEESLCQGILFETKTRTCYWKGIFVQCFWQ